MRVHITREGPDLPGAEGKQDNIEPLPGKRVPGKRGLFQGHGGSRAFSREVNSEASQEEALRLVQRLFVAPRPNEPHVVVLCGVAPESKCGRICVQMAEILARQVQSQVCLTDAKLRSPSLHLTFGLDAKPGLAESMAPGFPALSSCLQLTPKNLWLLPAGLNPDLPPLDLETLRLRVEELRSQFEYVFIEAPPLSESSDAVLWGKVSDGVVMVVDSRSTRKDIALQAKYDFEAAGAHLLGAVFSAR